MYEIYICIFKKTILPTKIINNIVKKINYFNDNVKIPFYILSAIKYFPQERIVYLKYIETA